MILRISQYTILFYFLFINLLWDLIILNEILANMVSQDF